MNFRLKFSCVRVLPITNIYLLIFSFVCLFSKIYLLQNEKCVPFLRIFMFFVTFIFKFRVPLGPTTKVLRTIMPSVMHEDRSSANSSSFFDLQSIQSNSEQLRLSMNSFDCSDEHLVYTSSKIKLRYVMARVCFPGIDYFRVSPCSRICELENISAYQETLCFLDSTARVASGHPFPWTGESRRRRILTNSLLDYFYYLTRLDPKPTEVNPTRPDNIFYKN